MCTCIISIDFCISSVPANTAIYQSAAAFVFIISVPLLKERITLVKVIIESYNLCETSLALHALSEMGDLLIISEAYQYTNFGYLFIRSDMYTSHSFDRA